MPPEYDTAGEAPVRAGVITSIRPQKKNTRRLAVFLDETFAFGVHQDVLLEHALHTGLYLDESAVRALLRADALLRAKEAAMTFLGHRARTEAEIRRKLERKGFTVDIVAAVLARLRELGYVDDARFARDFVRDRFNHRGYGPERLRVALRQAGVDSGLIEETLSGWVDKDRLFDAALSLAEKKWRKVASEPDAMRRRRKLYNYLLRRGYATETVREVVEHISRSES